MTGNRSVLAPVGVLTCLLVISCGPNQTARDLIATHDRIAASPESYFTPQHFTICEEKATGRREHVTGNLALRKTGPVRHFTDRNQFMKRRAQRIAHHGHVEYALAVPVVVTEATGGWKLRRQVGQKLLMACFFNIIDGKAEFSFVANDADLPRGAAPIVVYSPVRI